MFLRNEGKLSSIIVKYYDDFLLTKVKMFLGSIRKSLFRKSFVALQLHHVNITGYITEKKTLCDV
ncbi:hypothetical protein DICVIV_05979 [Dictyocaulus viviparus]|uniref:Uncharacterized protein n=1 Tax=Dictyocaulus viviparus TaxID=29172 RepID=A0A0D8XVR5_DICVI|nr:hypothetical protein DICVIV_05979 [Dictyocaulus viviparus]